MTITDTFNRPLRDLRISVTDRCNFRCTYCMPKEIFGQDAVERWFSSDQIQGLLRFTDTLSIQKK